jgi:hypothetical protein
VPGLALARSASKQVHSFGDWHILVKRPEMRAHSAQTDPLCKALKRWVVLKIRRHWLLDGKVNSHHVQVRAHPADEQRHDVARDNLRVTLVTNDVAMCPPALVPADPREALAVWPKVDEPMPHDAEA